jgi:hypothetical protein
MGIGGAVCLGARGTRQAGRSNDTRRGNDLARGIANCAFDGVDLDGAVELAAVAPGLPRVIAGTAVHRRERVVVEDLLPCLLPETGAGMIEPRLNVLAGGAGRVARQQMPDPLRQLPAARA